MAQKVQVLLVDDLDGGEAEETVSFAVDGSSYEIDLSGKNAAKLRDALAPFVEAARKAPAKSGRSSRRQQRNAPSRERSAEIRAWAKAAGKQVNERGRIPASIVAEYDAAQQR
ncbi:histone-like nucleoid-structuring protein Lsr2 [Marinactinospora thermotolerans]|uniref:Lsr2 protein n=1 Tax=Marinactinospora thermotolerans DSM 45154 TaxID=1122192 RepID=A0A1T4SSG0_9ACTN|nr:Lsr2 family protein [Marinactinospora thermotolerans]SKA31175.1 Lsr2 protein [Marinactinospora thermotolerans DSM 45154]